MGHEAIVGRASSRDDGDSGIGGVNSWGSIGGVNSGGGIGGGSSIGVNCGGNHGVSGGVDRGASSVVSKRGFLQGFESPPSPVVSTKRNLCTSIRWPL